MPSGRFLAMVASLVALGAGCRGGADAASPAARKVIWFGAHPDDELTVAPYLAGECVEAGSDCLLVVATRGEAGGCALPGGCLPDLPTVRSAELAASAALFGARVVQWDLGDGTAGGPDAVLAAWRARAGGDAPLAALVGELLARERPDRVILFDPRHGTTCHSDHRAIATLVMDAVVALGADAPEALVLESWPQQSLDPVATGFTAAAPADPLAWAWDATTPLPAAGGDGWGFLLAALDAYPSQAGGNLDRDAFAAAPPAWRRVWFVELAAALAAMDPAYTGLCG